ncbi:MAG: hypothetical protein EXX96DRAFT_649199, partial [Benjaminiella poitrasii]
MNPIYVDPYAHLSHTRHWLSANNKQAKKADVPKKRTVPSKTVKKFDARVIDTFCFHWPEMRSYVLVRVLDRTIAILPIRSRLAFLYFHHAPSPHHPSPQDLRKPITDDPRSSGRIQAMFKSWKHTLAFESVDDKTEQEPEEENEEDKEEEVEKEKKKSSSVSNEASTLDDNSSSNDDQKSYANISLADVMANESNLNDGWIHAPCTVTDDENRFDNNLILITQHAMLRLTARCFSEKMMFVNLVKLKQQRQSFDSLNQEDDESNQSLTLITANQILNSFQRKTAQQLENIQDAMSRLNVAKENISSYSHQLLEMDQSLDSLLDSTLNLQFDSLKRVLDFVNHQLADSITEFQSSQSRITLLQDRVTVHITFLQGARQRYEQIKNTVRNHAWYPLLYIAIVLFLVWFVFGHHIVFNITKYLF